MSFIHSILHISISYGMLFLLGLGVTLYCLPAKIRHYSMYISPAVGYISFCFFSIWFSGLTNAAVTTSNIFALMGLSTLTVAALVQYRTDIRELLHSVRTLLLLLGVMLVVVFTPVLLQGADLYIGTANPDFYQSLAFHEILVNYHAKFWVDHASLPLSGPFLEFFPSQFQARFGGTAYSILLTQLFELPARTALLCAIISFLLCLPAVVYFFCRTVLEFDKTAAVLSAILVAIAAPTTMSFIHILVGQNSALAAFPLAIALSYLAMKERSAGLMFLSALILGGVFWLYVMVIPYVLAPLALYSLIKLKNEGIRKLASHLYFGLALVVFGAVTHIGILSETKLFLNNLLGLVGKLSLTHFYSDFLTEQVFIYATGLSSYPIANSLIFKSFPQISNFTLTGIGFSLAAVYLFGVHQWAKKNTSNDAVLLVIAMLTVYASVWVLYTFIKPYGYASFKMSAWLQFLAVPFFAWLTVNRWRSISIPDMNSRRWPSYIILVLLIPIYAGLNLFSDLDYGIKSFGRDRQHGSLMNSYGISGNKDFLDLPYDLQSKIPAGKTVAIGFSDFVEQLWAAYYLQPLGPDTKFLSHSDFPDEDSALPDIHTREYKDSLGVLRFDKQRYFPENNVDYYLLHDVNNLNSEIIDHPYKGVPVWNNNTFSLFKNNDVKDIVTLGRGFYRAEYMETSALSWWWPKTFRWSSEGGEIYHLVPSAPGMGHSVAFSVIAGLGLSDGKRTIELWHNGNKFDEIVINGAARVISQPYFPLDGSNRLVLRVKEKAQLLPSKNVLWNRNITRRKGQINLLFSNIQILTDSTNSNRIFPVNKSIGFKQFFDIADTFNGFNVDGWVRNAAEFSARVHPTANRARFQILIPGNLGFSYPYKVEFIINGVSTQREFSNPGEYFVDVDFISIPSVDTLKIKIIPQASKNIVDGMAQREVVQSIRLTSAIFLTH